MSHSTGFPPIADKQARILILGSMPGQKSLQENQYYAHPRNGFWPILFKLFNVNGELTYTKRKALLIKHKIALWDVLKQCERKGSLDADIDHATIQTNNFIDFFAKHTRIKTVFFNGAKAEQLYKKMLLNEPGQPYHDLNYFRLPSTSPAHAAMKFEEKYARWEIIKNYITE